MHRYFLVNIDTEYGKGIWICETNSDGWSIKQAEIYDSVTLVAPKDMNFADFKLPVGFENEPFKEITKEEFDSYYQKVESSKA